MPHPKAEYFGLLTFAMTLDTLLIQSLVFNSAMTAAKISYTGTKPSKYSLKSTQLLTAVGNAGTLVSLAHKPYPEHTKSEVQISIRMGEYDTQEVILENGEKLLYIVLNWVESTERETTTYPMIGLLKAKRLQADNSINPDDEVDISNRLNQRKTTA